MKLSRQPLRILIRSQVKGHNSAAFIFALLIIGLSLASDASAQTTTTAAATTAQQQADNAAVARNAAHAKSTVRGRVVYDDTNRPLRRVQVTIYDPNGRNDGLYRSTWTDGNGEFTLKNVAAGKYYVTVEAPGIIRQEYNSGIDVTDIATVSVNGTNSSDVKVRVRRGAVISGKVTYSDGEPVINARLNIMRKKDGQLLPIYLREDCGNGVQTDERGIYRVSGLSPGEYVIGAGEQSYGETSMETGEGAYLSRSMMAVTYYEGATYARGATPVQVEAGNETGNINITLVDRSTHKISGTLTMRGDSRPVTRAMIELVSKDEQNATAFVENPMVFPDAQGQWSFNEVADGIYIIKVAPVRDRKGQIVGSSAGANSAPQPFISKRHDVTLAGSDITGLAIELSTGGSISGTIVVEGAKPLPTAIVVAAESGDGERRVHLPNPARVRSDGTFTIDGIPSDGVWLRAVSWRDNKYYTKSVTVGGVDLSHQPIIVKDGEEVKGVRIVISPDVATLTGRVLEAGGGATLRSASVMLVPTEPSISRIRSARLYAVTNADGAFTLTGAPGEYIAIALRPGSEPHLLTDVDIKARAAVSQRVTLQPNERKTIDLIAPGNDGK
jgi:hypothetical protein